MQVRVLRTSMEQSDEDFGRLIDPAMAGDARALEQLFLLLLPRVRNLVRYLVRGDKDTDDLSQEALLRILNGMASYRCEGPFRAWADRVVVRSVFARLKRVTPTPLGDGIEQLAGDDPSGALWPDSYCDRRRLVALLDELPSEQRDPLVLHYVVGMTIREIAFETKAPEETVRSRIRLGKDRLRQWLSDPIQSAAG